MMKRRLLALFLAAVLCLCSVFNVCALESDTEVAEQMPENQATQENDVTDYFKIYILAGTVIGAMVIVTLLYKKKDEIRYL